MGLENCKIEQARKKRQNEETFLPFQAIDKKPQPKTPEGAPDTLYYLPVNTFKPAEDPALKELEKCLKEIKGFKQYVVVDKFPCEINDNPEWAEDYFHIYADGTVTVAIPPVSSDMGVKIIQEGQTKRLEGVCECLDKVLTPSYTSTQNIYFAGDNCKDREIQLMLSYIDGGNMLPAENFAIIGKDSLEMTCKLNHITESEAKALIAKETGYKVFELCFVEQPYYHIDLAMMYVGKNEEGKQRVWVKQDNRGVPLHLLHQQLRDFGLEVIVDTENIAGKDGGDIPDSKKDRLDMHWEYNFFNGEYLRHNGKLYYITNDVQEEVSSTEQAGGNEKVGEEKKDAAKVGSRKSAADIKADFEKKLNELLGTKVTVIFCTQSNQNTLNKTHGGIGCRFKGGVEAAQKALCHE